MHLSVALQEIGQLDLEASGLHEVVERLIESYGFLGRPIVLGAAVKEISHPVESILYLALSHNVSVIIQCSAENISCRNVHSSTRGTTTSWQ